MIMTMVFSSVTYALKAQRLLDSRHIYTTLVRSGAVSAVRGCGYGLRPIHDGLTEKALVILAEAGITVLGLAEDG